MTRAGDKRTSDRRIQLPEDSDGDIEVVVVVIVVGIHSLIAARKRGLPMLPEKTLFYLDGDIT